MSEEELAELAEVEPAFARRAVRAGALKASGDGGFGPQDATRLRFLRAWDAAGLPVEAIGDLIPAASCPSRSWTSRSWPPSRGCQGPIRTSAPSRASQVEEPLRQAGATEQDLLDTSGMTGAQLPPLLQQTLLAVYRRHRQHVWVDHSIGHLERILEANGLHQRLEAPPCVCFADLTGYTRLTEEQGDAASAELAGRLAALVEGISRRNRGRPVRWLGDGGMFVFREPADAVRAALEMVAQAPGAGLPPTHIGIHSGPVVFQDGDVYGTTVNIAARLSARAAPGEVLVSRPAADRIPHPDHLEPLGPVELKGVAQPLEVFRAGAGPAATSGPGGSRW